MIWQSAVAKKSSNNIDINIKRRLLRGSVDVSQHCSVLNEDLDTGFSNLFILCSLEFIVLCLDANIRKMMPNTIGNDDIKKKQVRKIGKPLY